VFSYGANFSRAGQVGPAGKLELGMKKQYTHYRLKHSVEPVVTKLLIVFLMYPSVLTCYGGCSTNWFPISQKGQQKQPSSEEAEFARLREQMVREQLQGRDIKDQRVLEAMLKVPRHEFVPRDFARSAYNDGALPLKMGQTISQPYIVAYMTQALELKGTERILEIGTGSGYQAAVLAEIAAEVYTIEILPQLQEEAAAVLNKLGYQNIHFRVGDGYLGWPENAPFDCIIVTAAPERVPQPLIDQLKEGGRMIVPVGVISQDLVLVEKEKSGVTRHTMIPVRFVPMTGKAQEQ
jgi:protein-L-isoaspartate(D-aspartate) O-methyltransferase